MTLADVGRAARPGYPDAADVIGGVTMLPYQALQSWWHVQSGQLLRAGPKQAILLNAAAPGALVRQMESISRDPFATLQACGRGRSGRTRHHLAGNALGTGGGTLEFLPNLSFRQLSGRPARRRSSATPPPRRPTIAPRCGATRATTSCSSRAFLAVLANGEIDEAVKLAERVAADRQDRPHRAARARRTRDQAEAVSDRAPATRPVDPRPDHRSHRDLLAAWTMASPTEVKAAIDTIDKLTGPDWYAIFKDLHAGDDP